MKSFLFLLFCGLSMSQLNIRLLSIGDRFQVDSIEHEILINTIQLYNSNEAEKIIYEVDTLSSFDEVLRRLKNATIDERDVIFGMASITRTDERKEVLDFSTVYIPAREVITTLKKNKHLTFKDIRNQKVGYQSRSIEEISIKRISKEIPLKPVGFLHYAEKTEALLNGEIKFAIDDNISIWDNSNFVVIHELKVQNGDGIAIAFPKGSKLRSKLDRYLNYYLNSARFYRVISKKYGLEIARYFKKHLRLINDNL